MIEGKVFFSRSTFFFFHPKNFFFIQVYNFFQSKSFVNMIFFALGQTFFAVVDLNFVTEDKSTYFLVFEWGRENFGSL